MTFTSGRLKGKTVRYSVGRSFFDREAVLLAVEKTKRRRLSMAGAFVRRRAKSSIRKARRKRLGELTPKEREVYAYYVDKAKAEGRPKPRPWWFKHSDPGEPPRSIQGLLREHIYFVWDDRSKSVVVGPALLNGSPPSNPIPAILEFGGRTTNRRNRLVSIAPRPYMRPALAAEMDRFPELFRNAVR